MEGRARCVSEFQTRLTDRGRILSRSRSEFAGEAATEYQMKCERRISRAKVELHPSFSAAVLSLNSPVLNVYREDNESLLNPSSSSAVSQRSDSSVTARSQKSKQKVSVYGRCYRTGVTSIQSDPRRCFSSVNINSVLHNFLRLWREAVGGLS